MNGIHDLGGMHGFGPVVREEHEPIFHAAWEQRVFALALAAMGLRKFNTDEFRRTIERMPAADYLTATYYERWLHALTALLIEKAVIGRAELAMASGPRGAAEANAHPDALVASPARSVANERASSGGANALRYDRRFTPRFKPGDRVSARNLNPEGHTRMPRYVRGHSGVVRHDWGVFVLPDTHAHGGGAKPEHCYGVEFNARELWGAAHAARERVYVDLWESYLAPVPASATAARPTHSVPAKPSSVTRPRVRGRVQPQKTKPKTRSR